MIYGYARVSTMGQATAGNSLEDQRAALRAAGCQTIIEEAYTGKTADRPAFNRLLAKLTDGDMLVVTKLDRFARNVDDGRATIDMLLGKGVSIRIMDMGIIDKTSGGKLIYTIFLAFAEFERARINERTQAGKEIAKQKPGYREGRPRTPQARLDLAISMLAKNSYNQVARATGISKSTLIREMHRRRTQNT